ncbi:GNAT family N-acetyltransferase [Paenibacillus apiarius]|uniref:GNAT family N-acetyltransferase n=1 Tax=Paenibacillus apiarius TaxID=46240 RepID=A0ABT4DVQ4_9BACL|nr:GNAT family N-acetyltransferase [Paenibacillus apiarius]MBN3526775.1 GNAT family N-acetyltransferase [Paenibacillus apiarius]MCY9513204.1 GNAT family N-acetyltransferase [Paenibacillus apiarius]MCY9521437.1 GNAT family N-acetyltransferase [Paenibacillus apiarius]MCY9554417.1 GNAT family N-acetyltransferase [Paenibacillus apiarius]MCY9560620.1 GNAT family N-acetyltransferase [Paenibacillus apiarius]
MSVMVRPVEPSDKQELTSLMYEYIVDFYQRPKPEMEKVHCLIDTLLEKKRGIQFTAQKEGKLIGFATLYFTFSTTVSDQITVMNDLYVVEEARGTGAAQALFQACATFTKENGYARMTWITASDNYRAQRFYDKMGGTRGNWINYSIGR